MTASFHGLKSKLRPVPRKNHGFHLFFVLEILHDFDLNCRNIHQDRFIAPQAQLEESANDRSKPEEPISRVLMRTPGSGIGLVLGRFPEYRKHFECPKQGTRPGSDEPDFVCVCVCLCFFLLGPFLIRSTQI